jgi:hypothetical protein
MMVLQVKFIPGLLRPRVDRSEGTWPQREPPMCARTRHRESQASSDGSLYGIGASENTMIRFADFLRPPLP